MNDKAFAAALLLAAPIVAHALERSVGKTHPLELAENSFGLDKETVAVAMARKGKRGAKRAAPSIAKVSKPADEEILSIAALDEILAGHQTSTPALRDAPAAIQKGPALSPAFRPAMPTPNAIPERPDAAKRPAARPSWAKANAFTASVCRESARSLREAIHGASEKGGGLATPIARKKLVAELKRQQSALAGKDVPEDVEIALLTTDAETELHIALLRLEDPKLSSKAFSTEILPAIRRAAASLEQAARRL